MNAEALNSFFVHKVGDDKHGIGMQISIISYWENKDNRDLVRSDIDSNFQSGPIRLKLYQYKSDYGINDVFHDRFALMDDKIWHCGSTVGGVYGNGITAMSGAWNDIDSGFKNLVLDVINRYCEEVK